MDIQGFLHEQLLTAASSFMRELFHMVRPRQLNIYGTFGFSDPSLTGISCGLIPFVLKTETVVGEPMVFGDTTVVPLITVSFGYGTGSGSATADKGNGGTGGGLGAGARIIPNSVLVIKNGEVTILGAKGKSNLSTLVEMVPDIMSKVNVKLGKHPSQEGSDASSEPDRTVPAEHENAE